MARPTVRTRITAAGDKRAARSTSRLISNAQSPDHAAHGHWTFLTNHSHVLILLARNPSMILREVATIVGITERAVQRIIADLEGEGCIEREKVGRQNHYRIIRGRKLRHAIEAHRTIGDLLSILGEPG
jgi:DNA-binding MarR family transcriptional regulator